MRCLLLCSGVDGPVLLNIPLPVYHSSSGFFCCCCFFNYYYYYVANVLFWLAWTFRSGFVRGLKMERRSVGKRGEEKESVADRGGGEFMG